VTFIPSRLARFFLASLLVLVTPYVVSGFSRTVPDVESGLSRTNAPNTHDDGVWQSARQITTTSGTSFRIGKHDLRTATIVRPRTLTAVCSRLTDEFGNPAGDRSPQHSIPLLN
jgi:hypothetical protein